MTVIFKSLGLILKVYPRSNLTQIWPKLCSKTVLSRTKNYLCERIGQIRLFWRNVRLGSVICGSPSCMPCSLSLLLSESDRYFENIAFASLKSPKQTQKHKSKHHGSNFMSFYSIFLSIKTRKFRL